MDNTSPPHSPYSFTVVSSPYSPRTSDYLHYGYITLIDSKSEAEDEEDGEDENADDEIAWEDVIPVSNPKITGSDEEKDALGDGEEDSVSDAEDAASDTAEDAVNDTTEDSVNDTVHPLDGHTDGKLDQSDIRQLNADYATVLNILLGMKARMDQLSNELPKKVRFDSELPKINQINHPNSSRKRKSAMTPCTVPETKKRRQYREVNVRPIRATVDGEFTCLWQRGKSGKYCWVSDPNGTERKELDGEFLLLHGPMLSVEVRPNGDWLPISVRLNEKRDVYEGRDSLDSNTRMEIDKDQMFNLVRGAGRSHIFRMGKHF